ncbi:hypothetical protein TNCV_1443291 [Trichonephila clavipes]|nr:hypothetical protein TNCV_1443291 [Trichonephila clavipes]
MSSKCIDICAWDVIQLYWNMCVGCHPIILKYVRMLRTDFWFSPYILAILSYEKMPSNVHEMDSYDSESLMACSSKLSIDESMVPYYGHHSSRMFIKGKPIRSYALAYLLLYLVSLFTSAGTGEYFPPLQFTCRNCGGGDRGRVTIYRPFGEFLRA